MDESTIRGTVTARECGCCGHHEIGVTTGDIIYDGSCNDEG